jgi:hypothetical protein
VPTGIRKFSCSRFPSLETRIEELRFFKARHAEEPIILPQPAEGKEIPGPPFEDEGHRFEHARALFQCIAGITDFKQTLFIDRLFYKREDLIFFPYFPEFSRMARSAEELASRIQEDDDVMRYIRAVNIRADRDFIEKWGLMLQEADDIERSADLYSNYNLLPFMRSLNDSMETEYLDFDPDEKLSNNAQEKETVELFGTIERFTLLLHESFIVVQIMRDRQ